MIMMTIRFEYGVEKFHFSSMKIHIPSLKSNLIYSFAMWFTDYPVDWGKNKENNNNFIINFFIFFRCSFLLSYLLI